MPFVVRRPLPRVLSSSVAALLALAGAAAQADTFNWNLPTGGGSWITDANWSPLVPGDYPKDAGDIANLTANLTAAAPITLDGAITLGALTIGDTNNSNTYTLSDGTGGSLTFDNLGTAATLTEAATGLNDVISATIKTVGDLNIVDLNTATTRTFTLSGALTSSATSGTQLLTFSQASANAAVVLSGSVGDGATGGKIAITKTGLGTLSLRNTIGTTANAFSGDLTISGGTVRGEVTGAVSGTGVPVGSNPFGTAKILLNGGSFGVYNNGDGTSTAQTIVYGNNVDLNANGSIDVFHNGTAAGTNKTFQFGTLTVNGDFTYSQNGGNADSIRFDGGALLHGNLTIQGTSGKTTLLAINGLTEDATPRSVTFNLVGTAHTTTITGTSNYTGGTIVNNSTVTGAAANAFGNVGTITMAAGNLRLNNYAAAASVDVAPNQTLNMTGGILSMATAASASFPMVAVNITGGTTNSLNGAAIGTAATGSIATLNAPLNISGNPTVGSVSSTNLSVTVGGLTTLNSNLILSPTNTFRLTSIVEDATPRKITKIGAGFFTLSGGTMNWTGGLDILAGSAQVNATGAAGTGVINLGDTTGTNAATVLAGPTINVTNDIVVRAGSTGVMKISRDNSSAMGTGSFSGLITLNKDVTFENTSTAAVGQAMLNIDGKVTGSNVKIATNARNTNNVNEIIRFANAANDFGFATATPDAINVGPGVAIFNNDATMGAAGNGITLTATTSVFRLDSTFTMNRTVTFNAAGSEIDVTAGNEVILPLDGQILGSTGFVKGSPGILTIKGNHSARTLGTSAIAGTLRIASSDNIGTASPVTLSGSAIFDLRNDVGTTYTNAITLAGSATINVDQAVGGIGTGQTHTISPIAITSTTAPTLTTTGANGYSLVTGAITGAVAESVTNNIAGGGTLTIPSITYTGTAAGTTTLRGTGSMIVTGGINATGSGTLAFTKSDAGTVYIVGPSSYTGNTVISNGTLRITDAGALGTSGNVSMAANAVLALANETSTTYPLNLTLTGSSSVNVDHTPTGSATGNKHTIGTVNFASQTFTATGANDYSLDTGAVTITDTATITGNVGGLGKLSLASITLNNTTALSSRTLTIRGLGNTVVAGAITQTGTIAYNLTKLDNGTLTLNGATSIAGNIAIGSATGGGGTLKVGAASAIASNQVSVLSGTLDLNGVNSAPSNLILGGGLTGTAANLITHGAVLMLASNVTYNSTAGFLGATITGDVNLGNVTRSFNVADTAGLEPDLKVDGAIADDLAGIVKLGAGSLLLAGTTPNTWAGATNLGAGNLLLGKTAGVNAIPGDLTGTPTTSNPLLKNAASQQIPDTASVNLSGIAGIGSVNWDLAGFDETIANLTISNNQGTSSMVVETNGGTLTVTSSINISGVSTAGSPSALFPALKGNVIDGNLNLGGGQLPIFVAATANALFSGTVSNGGIVKQGATSLQLTGNNTYAGGTEIQAGSVDARTLTALGTGGVTLNGGNLILRQDGDGTSSPETFAFPNAITASSNGTITVDRIGTTATSKTITIPSLTVQPTATTVTVVTNNSYNFEVLSALSLTSLVKQGTGSMALNLTPTLAKLSVQGGTVNGSAKLTLTDDFSPLTLRNGTVTNDILLTGGPGAAVTFESAANGTGTISGLLDLGTGDRLFNVANGAATPDLNVANELKGTSNWTLIGGGRLQLAGFSPNTYTGLVTVTNGTLFLAKPSGITSITGDLQISGGSVFYADQASDQIVDTANVIMDSGNFAFAPATTTTVGNASETIASFTMNGGMFRTAVAPTFPITPIGGHNHITVTGTFTLNNGDFALNSFSSMSVNKFILNGGANVIGGNSTLEVDTLTIGPGGLEITGGQMKMNLGNTGDTNMGTRIVLNGDVTSFASGIEAGIFGESAAGSFGTRTVDIGSATRRFTVEDGAAINDLRVQFPIIGSGTLVKAGPGQLFLEGASTYSGNTEISEGTVALGFAASFASPTVHVAAGATLDVVQQFSGYNLPAGQTLKVDGTLNGTVNVSGVLSGSGSITQNVNVMAGGILAPGGSPGVLNMNGILTFNDGSFFSAELGGKTPGTGAGHYDQLNNLSLFNSVFIGNDVTLNISVTGGFSPSLSDVFYVLTRVDEVSFFPPLFVNADEGATVDFGNGVTGKITYQANWTGDQATSTLTGGDDIAIYNVVAVPEPGAATLLLGGLALFTRRRRSRS